MSRHPGFNPHITVATVVPDEGRYLMVEETVGGDVLINQPAGHLDSGETLLQAAVRETYEETGCRIKLTGFIGLYQWDHPSGEHFVRATFAGELLDHPPVDPPDPGIIARHWMTRDAVAEASERLRSPMVLQCIDDFEGGRLHSLELMRSLMP